MPKLLPHVETLESRHLLTTGWGVEAIHAPEVWDDGYTGQGVVVAVIDSGIDGHPDLVPNIWFNRDEVRNNRDDDGNGYIDDQNGWNFVDDNNLPLGKSKHGTHVAGVIAALRNEFGNTGVAPDAKIMPLRIFSESGTASTNDIADAIRYAVENDADVINLSIGGTATRNLIKAMEYAAANEVLIVAAAGNDGESAPVFPASESANLSNVISVGSHGTSYILTSTSNRVGSSGAVQVDAPGEHIESTVTGNTFAKSSGTSTAAAHVAGIAALARSANPSISAAALRAAIVQGATRRVAGSDSRGAVDARRTIDLVVSSNITIGVPQNADFDHDGVIDFPDFVVLAQHYGEKNVSHLSGDATGDGEVGFADFLVLAQSYGKKLDPSSRRPRQDALATGGQPAPSIDLPNVQVSAQTGRPEAIAGAPSIPSPNPDEVDLAIAEIADESPPLTAAELLSNLFSSGRI